MKVLFAFRNFLPMIGGIELLMLNVGTELVKRGHSVTVYTTNTINQKRSSLKPVENISGMRVKRFDWAPFPRRVLISLKLFADIVLSDFDLVHTFSYEPGLFTNIISLAAILKRKPLVTTPVYHPYSTSVNPSFLDKCLTLFFQKRIGPKILRKASYVTSLTESEKELYIKAGVSRVVTIAEGVHIPKPSRDEVAKFRKKYGLDNKVLLSVGRIIRYKRNDLAIGALRNVLKSFPQAQLLIVGPDEGYQSKLKDIAKTLGCDTNVVFTGKLNDSELICAYESSYVVVHTSRVESFARIALEAWSQKKPIVCFDLGGPTSFIKPSEGVLVKNGDIEELTKTIVRLLSNEKKCQTMGENGYNLVKQKYLWSQKAKEYELIYKLAVHSILDI